MITAAIVAMITDWITAENMKVRVGQQLLSSCNDKIP